jgi:hypothetical protein
MQVPVDLPAVLSIAAVAAAVRGRAEVKLTNSWSEPLNLYCAVIANPGERKSPTLARIIWPLREAEARASEETRMEREWSEQDVRLAAQAENAAEKDYGRQKATIDEVRMATEARRQAEEKLVPPIRRIVGGDITPEALVDELAAQGGALAMLTSEGGLFDTFVGGRYSSGLANIDALLQSHDGREPITVLRKSPTPLVMSLSVRLSGL